MSERSKSDWAKLKTVKTPKFRVSFPHVFEPHAFEKNPAKYSIVMLFPKDTDLKALKMACNAAAAQKWGTDTSKWPKNAGGQPIRMPFRDGAEKTDLQGYEGNIFVSASTKTKPGLVDQKLQPIEAESDFYAGCYARAELQAFAYDTNGNKGVSFALQNVQKLADGEPFAGKKKAEDTFNDDFEIPTDGLEIGEGGVDLGFN